MTTPGPNKRPAYEPAARLLQPTGYNPDMKRPASTTAGVALVMLRVLAGIIVLIGFPAIWDAALHDVTHEGLDAAPEITQLAGWIAIGFGIAVVALDAVFAVLIYLGHNWPRVLVMLVAAISISSAFVAWWSLDQDVTLPGTFLSLSLDILILLALSSRSAAAYARRNERH